MKYYKYSDGSAFYHYEVGDTVIVKYADDNTGGLFSSTPAGLPATIKGVDSRYRWSTKTPPPLSDGRGSMRLHSDEYFVDDKGHEEVEPTPETLKSAQPLNAEEMQLFGYDQQ